MLKNAIESADYFPDSRKRGHGLRCSYEKGINVTAGRLRAPTMAVFVTPDPIFVGFFCN